MKEDHHGAHTKFITQEMAKRNIYLCNDTRKEATPVDVGQSLDDLNQQTRDLGWEATDKTMFRYECDFNRLVMCESKADTTGCMAVEVCDPLGKQEPWCWRMAEALEGCSGGEKTEVWFIEVPYDVTWEVPAGALDVARTWLTKESKAGWTAAV